MPVRPHVPGPRGPADGRVLGELKSPWEDQGVVAGFSASPPNAALVAWAEQERRRAPAGRALDLGCGAARNAAPLAAFGWPVVGVDLFPAMLAAARERAARDGVLDRVRLVRAGMDALPFARGAFDVVIAHGIWNLARTGTEFRAALAEAARVARPRAGLFLFTFSRSTLASGDPPVPGETFVYTQFSGRPQVFLTGDEVVDELRRAGFAPDGPLEELNTRRGLAVASGPVIYQGAFRRT